MKTGYSEAGSEKYKNSCEGSNYNILFRNCLDFADALKREYFRLGGTVDCP